MNRVFGTLTRPLNLASFFSGLIAGLCFVSCGSTVKSQQDFLNALPESNVVKSPAAISKKLEAQPIPINVAVEGELNDEARVVNYKGQKSPYRVFSFVPDTHGAKIEVEGLPQNAGFKKRSFIMPVVWVFQQNNEPWTQLKNIRYRIENKLWGGDTFHATWVAEQLEPGKTYYLVLVSRPETLVRTKKNDPNRSIASYDHFNDLPLVSDAESTSASPFGAFKISVNARR